MGVLVVFVVVFWQNNITYEAATQSLKNLAPLNPTLIHTLETSPFTITVSLFGADKQVCNNFVVTLSGIQREILIVEACNNCIETDVCFSKDGNCDLVGNEGNAIDDKYIGAHYCTISARVPPNTALEGVSTINFRFNDTSIPFYAQLVLYQITSKVTSHFN